MTKSDLARICAVLGVCAVVELLTGCSGTVSAPGFADAAFKKVKIGMSASDVNRVLGGPLSIDRIEDREYRVRLASGRIVPVIVSYDDKGGVERAVDPILERRSIRPGLPRGDTESCLHTSRSTVVGRRQIWHYTEPGSPFGEFRARRVEFDERGRVRAVHKFDVPAD